MDVERAAKAEDDGPPHSPGSGGAGSVAGSAVAGAGAAVTAAAAAACCVPVVSPFLIGVLGVSTAVWLAGLRPWAPYPLGAAFLLLLYAYWSLRRWRRCARHSGAAASAPRSWLPTVTRVLLVGATAVWLASAIAFVLLL